MTLVFFKDMISTAPAPNLSSPQKIGYMTRVALPLLDHIIWLQVFIYLLKECRDIYCRKEAFQRFEGMAENVSGNWYAALQPSFFTLTRRKGLHRDKQSARRRLLIH